MTLIASQITKKQRARMKIRERERERGHDMVCVFSLCLTTMLSEIIWSKLQCVSVRYLYS